jgi:integrase
MAHSKRPGKAEAHKRNLTELFVRKAQARDKAYLVWDERQRGLALRVQPTGNRSWVTVYSRGGRPRWLHHGNANAIGLSDARKLSAEAMLAVAKGGDPAADKKAQRSTGTFTELATRYREEYAKAHNRSWEQADKLVQRFAVPRWGKLQASSITRDDVKTLFSSITSKSVANQTKAHVSALFNWAIKEQILSANPAKLIDSNPTHGRERILSPSELPRFWEAFGELDPMRGAALKAILLLGQRPGECVNMRHEHIIDGWWTMPGEPIAGIWPGTKNGASHRLWIPKAAQPLLTGGDAPSPVGFVFPGLHRGQVGRLDKAMREICAKLGVKRATPHDLRRTHGSTITAMGFGRDAMNRVQNHKEGGITDIYDRHHYESVNKAIMESVANKIMALVEGRGGDNVVTFAR